MAHESVEGHFFEEGNCDILSKTPRWGNGQIPSTHERGTICGFGESIAFLRRNAGDCVVQGTAIGRGRGESLNIETRDAVSTRLFGAPGTIGENIFDRKCWEGDASLIVKMIALIASVPKKWGETFVPPPLNHASVKN